MGGDKARGGAVAALRRFLAYGNSGIVDASLPQQLLSALASHYDNRLMRQQGCCTLKCCPTVPVH